MKKIAMLLLAVIISTVVLWANGTNEKSSADTGRLELSASLIQYTQPPDADGDLWQYISDELNVDYQIDWIPPQGYGDKINVIISSGDLPDLMFVTSITEPTVLRAIKGGLFANLSPVLGDFSQFPNLKEVNPVAWTTSKVDGQNYLFPRSRGNYDVPVFFLRGDWLDELDMDVPATLDDFTEYLRAVVDKDMGENGTIGATSLSMFNFPGAFGIGTHTPVRPQGKTTGIVNRRLTESYALALGYWQERYAEGLVAKEYALFSGTEREDMFVTGKASTFDKNLWHKKRIENELQKTDKDAYVEIMFALEGPGGYAFHYDKGYAGGLLVDGKVKDDKLQKIVEFMDASADPNRYNLLCFGILGTHHEIVDGFPKLTELGSKEISSAIQYPFCLATNTFQKVDSPLADAAYNLENRADTQAALDPIFAKYPSPINLDILQSESWAIFWSQKKDEFAAYEAEVVTGKMSVDEFIAYQKDLMKDPLVIKSFDEYQKSFDVFGFKTK